ncbi:MAG: DUF3492 domain-containing protein [Verrucomicrobia bacterium]|nr:DUF3492 domain-containing protein [Verrucomicrobiota bacterium]
MSEGSQEADIVLMLEGTYPYVLGGVSSWVDQIVKGLPEFKFGLFFIGSKREQAQKPLYTLPSNIVSVTHVFLHDRFQDAELVPAATPSALRKRLYDHLSAFYLGESRPERLQAFWKWVQDLKEAGDSFTFGNLLRDPEAWEIMREVYGRFCPDESFIDFFGRAVSFTCHYGRSGSRISKCPRPNFITAFPRATPGLRGRWARSFMRFRT